MTLRTELSTDPLGRGYAAHLPDSPGIVADMLNAVNRTAVRSRFISARTVLAELGLGGAAILDALEAVAPAVSAVKWMMSFVKSDAGVDIGSPVAQGLVDLLVAGATLTAPQGAALKSLALQPCSRANELGLPPVSVLDVIGAI